MFVFIGGVQPRTVRLTDTPVLCTGCGQMSMAKKRTDQYISLFFIPLIRIRKGIPFVECDNCQGNSGRLKCSRCGYSLQGDFLYCPRCGTRI